MMMRYWAATAVVLVLGTNAAGAQDYAYDRGYRAGYADQSPPVGGSLEYRSGWQAGQDDVDDEEDEARRAMTADEARHEAEMKALDER
jgi:hypothetical protein